MERRHFLLSVTASGISSVSGCLSSNACDKSSNHLYIENQLSDTQEVDVRVFKKTDGLLTDGEWTDILLETVEIAGETHRVIEDVYDEYGTYQTEAECQFDHNFLSDQEISEIDKCDGQVTTIGIGENIVTILSGLPDHLSSENSSDTESTTLTH